jgi:hypothetical protein
VLAAVTAGCGGEASGIAKVVVQGAVTLDGQPIANGEVRFYPAQGTHGPVSGGAVRDGKYVAQGRGGVPVGKHTVEILAYRPAATRSANPEGGPAEQYLPKKFNEQTELTAEITGDENPATLDFALTSR